jgi:hypothetical protein
MNFPSIRIEGAILSPDILDRIEDAPGQKPADFGLAASSKVKDEIARAWADAQDYWRIFQRKLSQPSSPRRPQSSVLCPLSSVFGLTARRRNDPPAKPLRLTTGAMLRQRNMPTRLTTATPEGS